MSQHYFTSTHHGRPVTVLMGWDRPLSQFFLIIEHDGDEQSPEASEGKDEEILYSYLNDKHAWQKPLSYYREKLKQLGITVPESMFGQSLCDEAFNTGNRTCWHTADGEYKE